MVYVRIERGEYDERFCGELLAETTHFYKVKHATNPEGEWFAKNSRFTSCLIS
jgi:hypothetical protein